MNCPLHGNHIRSVSAAFSLVELLVTMALILMLMTMGFSIVQQQINAQKLAASVNQLADDCANVAQQAIKDNQTVYVVFQKKADGAVQRYKGYQMMKFSEKTGDFIPLAEAVTLPSGICFVESDVYSSLLKQRVVGQPCSIPFRPDGGTRLPTDAGQHWCITLASERDIETKGTDVLLPGSRTLVINAQTGATVVY